MRIRSILPKFYESEDVGRMDWTTRLVFIGLWSYADDNGVGRDVPALISADLFPFDLSRDSRDTLARVADSLQQLSDGGQIVRYTIDGSPLLFVVKWDDYQRVDRPAKSRYERPTSENAVIRETVATPSRDSRDTLAPGEGEKGRRGEVEKTWSPADADDPSSILDPDSPAPKKTTDRVLDSEFEAHFWPQYPRKVAKPKAQQAYRAARREASLTEILNGLTEYLRTKPSYADWAHPSTWLNGDRWLDEAPADDRRPSDDSWDHLKRDPDEVE